MKGELIKRIGYIFQNCHSLVTEVFQDEYAISGNVGVFAQGEDEYISLKKQSEMLTKTSSNPNQKYFELKHPIVIESDGKRYEVTYLYVRKYDPTEYGRNKGDVDFVVSEESYASLRKKVENGDYPGAEIYNRPGWDNIQITRKGLDVVAYIGTMQMAKKARIKFDDLTNL